MTRQFVRYAALGVAAAGLIFAAKVTTDYDHNVDFGQYKTYSWTRVQAGNQLWQDRIAQAVDGQLTAKGWQKVESGGDTAVAAFGSTKEQQTLNTFYDGLGGGWFWRGFGGDGMATTTVENTPVGTLVVDIFDGRTKHLIWRGMGTETLSDKPEKNERKLEDTVQDMFKHFPPQGKG